MPNETQDPRTYNLYRNPAIPSLYEQVWSLNERYKAEVDFIVKEGTGNMGTVLDLGCGTGNHLSEIVKKGFSPIGLDINRYQLQRAQALFPELAGILIEGTMTQIPLPNGSIPIAISMSEAMNYLDQDGVVKTLKEAHRVMQNNGHLVIVSKWAQNLGGRGTESTTINGIRYTKTWTTQVDDQSMSSDEAVWEAEFQQLDTGLTQKEKHYFPFMNPFGIAKHASQIGFNNVAIYDIHSIYGNKIPLTLDNDERTAIIVGHK